MITQNPAIAPLYVNSGVVTAEEVDALNSSIFQRQADEEAAALRLHEGKSVIDARYREPRVPANRDYVKQLKGQIIMSKLTNQPPEEIAKLEETLASVEGGGKGDRRSATEAKAIIDANKRANVAADSFYRVEGLYDNITSGDTDMFSPGQKSAAVLQKFGEDVGGGMGSLITSIATGKTSPDTQMLKKDTIRLAAQDMQMFGGNDSNYELQLMLKSYPDNLLAKDAAVALATALYKLSAINKRAYQMEGQMMRDGSFFEDNKITQEGIWETAKKEILGDEYVAPQSSRSASPVNPQAPTQSGGWSIIP
jgi:hypothetical protein